MANRTNFVKVSNLPPGYTDAKEIFCTFSVCGVIQDITAVDPTTVVISYSMRYIGLIPCDSDRFVQVWSGERSICHVWD